MLPTEMQQREGRLCFRPLQPKQQDFLGEEGWGQETDPLLFTPYRELISPKTLQTQWAA